MSAVFTFVGAIVVAIVATLVEVMLSRRFESHRSLIIADSEFGEDNK
ncbi:hypothetical protein [Natronorarus salvus]